MRRDVRLAGVVMNRVASPRHAVLARAGEEAVTSLDALSRRVARLERGSDA